MNEQNIPQSNEPTQRVKQIWIAIIAIVSATIIIGGGVYVWQKSSSKTPEQSSQEKPTPIQSQIENPQVPMTPESTPELSQLSNETTHWTTYENKELGFSFNYPVNFGGFEITIGDGETGKSLIGYFQNSMYFLIGGVTEDYTINQPGGFLIFVQYLNEDGKYYHMSSSDKKTLVEPEKILTADGQEILIVDSNSYVEERNIQEGPVINPGVTGGALINIPGSGEFKGIAVWNSKTNHLSQSDFEEILKTFTFTK